MARKPRIEYPGAFFHIMVRGNNRENIFRQDADYRYYLSKLAHFSQEGKTILYAYCLMPNHVHLLLEMSQTPVSRVLQRFHTSYTAYLNKKYGRVGHVFQGRYKAVLCDKDAYLLELVRYIHSNPVRAGLVEHLEHYPWSSHRIYIGTDRSEAIDPSFVLRQFSESRHAAKEVYRSFVYKETSRGKSQELHRRFDQRILGNERFQKEVFHRVMREPEVMEQPRLHYDLEELKEIIGKVVGTPSASLKLGGQSDAWIRRIFCYVARNYGTHKGKDVARFIGKDPATVTQGVRVVEDLLRAGDQKTKDAVARILDTVNKKNISYKEIEENLASFFSQQTDRVTLAYLFGSVVSGKEGPLSDIDMAVCFRNEVAFRGRYDLAFQIKQLLGLGSVDLIVLNRAPVELKYSVVRNGKVVFSDSFETKVEFEAQVLSRYMDYLPVLERQRQEILEASHGATAVQRYRKAFGQTRRVLKQIGAIQEQVEGGI